MAIVESTALSQGSDTVSAKQRPENELYTGYIYKAYESNSWAMAHEHGLFLSSMLLIGINMRLGAPVSGTQQESRNFRTSILVSTTEQHLSLPGSPHIGTCPQQN